MFVCIVFYMAKIIYAMRFRSKCKFDAAFYSRNKIIKNGFAYLHTDVKDARKIIVRTIEMNVM